MDNTTHGKGSSQHLARDARPYPAHHRARYVDPVNTPQPPPDEPAAIIERATQALGAATVEALLGHQAGPETLTQLQALTPHLARAFTPEQAALWLRGHDSHLNARPVDVFRIDGATPVIEAIEAFEQGAFA